MKKKKLTESQVNELIEKKFFHHRSICKHKQFSDDDGPYCSIGCGKFIPLDYSTDISYAMALTCLFDSFTLNYTNHPPKFEAILTNKVGTDDYHSISVVAPTAPLAISLAALKYLEGV